MKLAQLLEHIDPIRVVGPVDIELTAVSRDSRVVGPSHLFVAIQGLHFDGHEALEGLDVRVIVVERPLDPPFDGTVVWVKSTRVAFAQLSAALHGHPASKLTVVGVTGTNGKTTLSTLVDQALGRLNIASARIGTLGTVVKGVPEPSQLTTPEADRLHALFASMVRRQVRVVCMEVSSIGVEQGRVEAIPFSLAVFTNLSRDHLDFHGSMASYREAKAQLFSRFLREKGGPVRALLCADDPVWRHLHAPSDRWTYGFSSDADVHGQWDGRTQEVRVRTPMGEGRFSSPLFGRHNVQNLLGVLGVLLILGVELSPALRALERSECVPGRLELVSNDRGLRVLVDYAHTPDALETVLRSLRSQTIGRLIVVFGAGGDRDAGKRSEMGVVAQKNADLVLLTSDNPRSESPQSIVNDLLRDVVFGPSVRVLLDRREAIACALKLASVDDTVLIAGKGHETYQEIAGERLVFDDRVVAREEMERS